MGWVRLDDAFYDHPKFEEVGPLGMALWAAAMGWCNRNLTDGHIPRTKALRLLDWEGVTEVLEKAHRNGVTNAVSNAPRNSDVAAVVAQMLVDARLWEVTDGGYAIHNYLDYQRSAEQIQAEAKGNAARQKRWRELHKGEKSNGDRNGVTNGTVTGAPNPNPNEVKTHTSTAESDSSDQANTAETVSSQDPAFKAFWDVYPRKVGKPAALKAWKQAIKKASPDVITAAARAYAADPRRKPDYTKHPGPWLNDERWNDQPATTQRRANHHEDWMR